MSFVVTGVLYSLSKMYLTAELVLRNLTAMRIEYINKPLSVFLLCVNQETLVSDYFDIIYSHRVSFRSCYSVSWER
jgi:hypothetical protein